MKKIHKMTCALALVSGALVAQAPATSQPMWQDFYAQLSAVVRGGNQDPGLMVCLDVPGVSLGPLSSKELADVTYVNQMLDRTAEFNPVFTPGKTPFSKIYGEILQYHQADKPVPLKPGEQADYDKAVELTRPKGQVMKLYQQYQDAYDTALTEQEAERWQNQENGRGLTVSSTTSTRVERTWTSWKTDGQKARVEAALGTVLKYSGGDPEAWWYGLESEFKGGAFKNTYLASTFPPMDQWSSEDGWMKFSFKAVDQQRAAKVNPGDLKTAALLSIGGYRGSAPASKAAARMNALASDQSLEITMEIKKVIINRPWMNWQVFTSDKWTWDRGVVSDGKGRGKLPLYTDGFVIVRKVKFTAKSIVSFKQDLLKELKAGGAASYGPFSLKGNPARKGASADSSEADEISIPDPQIIAYICSVVPRCPAKTVK